MSSTRTQFDLALVTARATYIPSGDAAVDAAEMAGMVERSIPGAQVHATSTDNAGWSLYATLPAGQGEEADCCGADGTLYVEHTVAL